MSQSIPTSVRDDFMLRRDMRLLNNGSYGACPKPVFAEYQRWQAELEYHPGGFIGRWASLLEVSRTRLADYLHTTQDRLGFVTNATMGVNVVAHSMRSYLKPSDEVLTTDHEYGACNHAWQFNCAKAGAIYVNHPIDLPITSNEDFIERFWSGVTPRTRVIYLSHTTSPTALTFPLEEICRRARAAGILTVIDGAHVPGQRDLFLDDLGADFYTGNCHKWMGAPKGTAFLHARRDAEHLIEPLIVGHGWIPGQPSAKPLYDYVEMFGTRDVAAFLTVPAALDYMQQHDWKSVQANCFAIAKQMKQDIEQQLGTQSICPDDFEWYSQLCPIRLPDNTDMDKLRHIFTEHYHIEMPLITWRGFKFARLSVQIYTSQDELDAFYEAVTTHVLACQLPSTESCI
ncbi:MAG: aminotransferase class V-fold PLP-dependent enzyme [Anaerolineae bacterium]|nr:aminotransferase class V-fold PLP-dependent enzyme [Anaerolineae bacterium]